MQSPSFLQQLTILHLALTGGATVLIIVLYFIAQQGFEPDPSLATIFLALAMGLAVMAIAVGYLLYQRGVAGLKPDQPLATRLNQYRSFFILRMALAEGAALFGGVTFLVSGNMIGLVISIVLLGWMVMLRPTADSLATALHLSGPERREVLGE